MKFLMELVGLGGGCKNVGYFCHYCEVDGNVDQDMYYVCEGDERCSICLHNGSKQCTHRAINSQEEIIRKGDVLREWMIEDVRKQWDNTTLELKEMMPNDAVECFAGYDDDKNWLTEMVKLPDTIGDDGEITRTPLDYIRQLVHTEELEEVVSGSVMYYNPGSLIPDTSNIDHEYSDDERNEFLGNIFNDLDLRGIAVPVDLPDDNVVSILRQCLVRGYHVRRYRAALELYESALQERLMDPGQCPPCILHHSNRTGEKLVKQIILAGLQLNQSSREEPKRKQQYLDRVGDVVTRLVFQRDLHEDDKSGWKVPMTKEGKLGEVNLSNKAARAFVNNFEHLIDACLDGHADPELTFEWKEMIVLHRSINDMLESKFHFEHEKMGRTLWNFFGRTPRAGHF
jgi:hypothetical protein